MNADPRDATRPMAATPVWRAVTATARGSSHVRSGLPNQDAALVRDVPHVGAIVSAVADGHGGSRYVRSDIGAGMAVAIACELGAHFATATSAERGRAVQRRAAVELVPQLVDRWTSSVLAHAQGNPFTEDERARAGVDLEHDVAFAYGATLLFSIATPSWVLIGQLGDGDVVVVDDHASVSRPMPRDDRLVAGQTTSLCLPDAPSDLRLSVLAAADVQTLVLSSDGYGNSFAGADWWQAVGRDLQTQVRETGLAAVAASLPEWAADSAEVGGDDVTIAVVTRVAAATAAAALDLTAPVPVSAAAVAAATPRPRRRWLLAVVLVALIAVVAGAVGVALAGGDDADGENDAVVTSAPATTQTTAPVAPAPTDPNLNKTTLVISEPQVDWQRESPVAFTGRIEPGADVTVAIRSVALDGSEVRTDVPVEIDADGSWRADVPLAPGANTIDVEASNDDLGYNPNLVTRTVRYVPNAPTITIDPLSEQQRRYSTSIVITGTADADSEIWLGDQKVATTAAGATTWSYRHTGAPGRLEFRAVNPAYPAGGAVAAIEVVQTAPTTTTARPRTTTTPPPAPTPSTTPPPTSPPPPETTAAPGPGANPTPGGQGGGQPTLPPEICADPSVPTGVKNGRCP